MHKSRTIIIGLLAVLLMAACAEPKKSRGQANTRGNGRTTNPGETGSTLATAMGCANGQGMWGVIYNSSSVGWQSHVVEFASAAVDKDNIGAVSNDVNSTTTGIGFCGRVGNASNAEVYIGIWDEWVTAEIPEIGINIRSGGPNNGKMVSPVGSTSVRFQDDYGWFEFQGNASGASGEFTGNFYFQNFKIVDNGVSRACRNSTECPPPTAPLGQFKIRRDAFFRTN